MLNLDELAQFACQLAKESGLILKKGFGTSFLVQSKTTKHDLVTEYDEKVEWFLKEKIRQSYPDHAILAEETVQEPFDLDKPCWILDPIDGTVNFAHQIPFFSISIAFAYKQEVLIGVVYHVMQDELFFAQKGLGAYSNNIRLQVSSIDHLSDAMLATGFPYDLIHNPNHCIEHFIRILKLGIPIRRMGSAALDLCYIAAGRFDGFWEVSLNPWDFAAGLLIVQEAQGVITNLEGADLNPFFPSSVLAANPKVHPRLLRHLKLN